MQIDRDDYSNKIYNLLHPNLRYFSEIGGFTNNENIPIEVREGGFLKMISDLLAEVFLKQKSKINHLDDFYNFSEFSGLDDSDIIYFENITYLDGEIMLDSDSDKYYFYFFNKRLLKPNELMDSTWSIYDHSTMSSISHSVLDMDKTEIENDTNYYYRLYLDDKLISLKKEYILLKPSFLYNVAKNKSIPLNLFNSRRTNISLLKNAYKFFINKSSVSNIKEVARSLEAEIELENYTVIPTEYSHLMSLGNEDSYVSKLKTKLMSNGETSGDAERIISEYFLDYSKGEGNTLIERTLVKGVMYATRFEDFKVDFIREWESIIFVKNEDVFSIVENMNKDIVIKEIDLNNNMYLSYSFDSSNQLSLKVDKTNSDSLFYKRIGLTDRWFLSVKIGAEEYVYSLESLNYGNSIDLVFKPFFKDIANYNNGLSLYEYIESNIDDVNLLDSEVYYEYFFYKPISYASNIFYFNLENEINSSSFKSNFNLYKYNKKVIDIFMPDYYEIIKGSIEFNGERTLF